MTAFVEVAHRAEKCRTGTQHHRTWFSWPIFFRSRARSHKRSRANSQRAQEIRIFGVRPESVRDDEQQHPGSRPEISAFHPAPQLEP